MTSNGEQEPEPIRKHIIGWASEVLIFYGELDVRDREWGVYDLIGAYELRRRIETSIHADPLSLAESAVLRAVDELLVSFTQPIDDPEGLRRILSDVPTEPWWWMRIPVRGPPRDEYDEILATSS